MFHLAGKQGRDPLSNRPVNITQSLVTEIVGAGNNPFRLTVSDQQDTVFVANNKGGEVASINVHSDTVEKRISINAPSAAPDESTGAFPPRATGQLVGPQSTTSPTREGQA